MAVITTGDHANITNPVTPGQPDALANVSSDWNRKLLIQNLLRGLSKRQGEAIYGRIPGQKGSTQGQELGRASPEEILQQLQGMGGGGGGGWGMIKEGGVLGALLSMADKGAAERQAASVEQLRLARLPLADLRAHVARVVEDGTPKDIADLMAGYKNLRGDVKEVLKGNLKKISDTAGEASTLARNLLNDDVDAMAKAIGKSSTEIQSHVDKANASLKGAVTEGRAQAKDIGAKTVGDISAAVEEARAGVVPGAMAREGAMGAGYGSLAQQQGRTLAGSKREGMGLAEQLGAGRKEEINQRFDEMAKREGDRVEQSLRSRGLQNTTVADTQRQGVLAKIERSRSDALRQLNDQVAQQKLGQFNEWEKLRAMTGERVGLPGLGARLQAGTSADRIAAQLAQAGLGAQAQASLATQGDQNALNRLQAGKAGDFQMAGLQGVLGQEAAKTSAIAGGWQQKMALSAKLAGLGFTEQANALRQQADAEREIGGRSLTALQQGQRDQAGQLADVTKAQSGLEERVTHKGLDPALLMSLAKGLGVASQQGAPLAGLMGNLPALMNMLPNFPGEKEKPGEAKDPVEKIVNQIRIINQMGGAPVMGPNNEVMVSDVDSSGNISYRPANEWEEQEYRDDKPNAPAKKDDPNQTASDTGTGSWRPQPNFQMIPVGGDVYYWNPETNTYITPDGTPVTDRETITSLKGEKDAADKEEKSEKTLSDIEAAAAAAAGKDSVFSDDDRKKLEALMQVGQPTQAQEAELQELIGRRERAGKNPNERGHMNIEEDFSLGDKKTPSANRVSAAFNPDGTPTAGHRYARQGLTHAEVHGKPKGATLTDGEWAAAEAVLTGTKNPNAAPVDTDSGYPIIKADTTTPKTVADLVATVPTDPVERARQTGDMSGLGYNVPATTSNPVASLVGSNQNQPVTSDQPVTGTPASATPSTVTNHAAAYRELLGAADLAKNRANQFNPDGTAKYPGASMESLRANNAANDYKKQYGSKFTP